MAKRFLSTRRKLLKGAAATIAAAVSPLTISSRSRAQSGLQTVNMQLGWITGGNQLGEIVAKRLGYFEQEKINFAIQAGGPNIDGVAIVASGRYEVGQVSSSPSLMLAASQGIPVTCFAVGAQEHPYAFFSLPRAPIHTPKDMIGRKIGVQATGQILLTALLRKNRIPEDQVQKVIIGSDMTPLMTGQVDAVTGWITNTTALKVLGPDHVTLRLWDAGVQLYALPYYATPETIQSKPDVLARFLRAAGKGWAYAHANRDRAIELLVKQYPNLVAADERAAADVMLDYCFDSHTKEAGFGAMDPAVWQSQIELYGNLGQFTKRVPKVEEVMTLDILNATAGARPRLG